MEFQTKDTVINVSKFDSNGWWLGNSSEHVAKGTALGPEFTGTIYNPSSEKMTARYDKSNDKWAESIDQTHVEFRDDNGNLYKIGKPDGELPKGAITKAPPEYDEETQSILFKDGNWEVFDILVGESYFEADGTEHIIQTKNFTLPEACTLQKPPAVVEGCVVRFIDGKWKQLKDHTGSVIYNKEDSTQSKVVIEVGDIEDAWTLEEPLLNSIWKDGSWVIQLDLLRESKRVEINAWRNAEESKTDQVVVVGDVTWNADPFSRARIESTIQSSYIPPIWTDANDIDQSITREALIAIHTAIVQQGFTIHARQREMKAELLALETIDELNNYIVGWEQIEES